jgi:hypothetical protein
MTERKILCVILKGNQEEDHLENKHTDGRIILNFDLKK